MQKLIERQYTHEINFNTRKVKIWEGGRFLGEFETNSLPLDLPELFVRTLNSLLGKGK